MTLQIDGLVTGIDTTSIIEGLTQLQQRQIALLDERRGGILQEQTAFSGIEARLLTLRSSSGQLARTADSVFNRKAVTSSDETLLTATASTSAAPGVYTLRVDSLAQAHQIASQSFESTQSEVTQGTLTLQLGSGSAVEITVDDQNNTVQGLADAINASEAEVTASIVNDGSGFRILLSGTETGAENTINVTNNLGASAGNAVQPDFTGDAVQDAADATLLLGSGAGAISVNSASNVVDDVIAGVTLQLNTANVSQTVTVQVSADSEPAVDAVTDFVDSFNGLMEFIDDQTQFVQESNLAGPLLGNRDVTVIQDRIRQAALEVVGGVSADANRLSTIGISINDAGRLSLNEGQLRDALEGRVEGVSQDDVRRLFTLGGDSTNAGIRFVLGSNRTNLDNQDVEVDITAAAERAEVTATNALAASTVITSANNTLDITIDAATATITLADGTYTQQELADEIAAAINSNADLPGREVTVGLDAGQLTVRSETYGSTSQVTVTGGTAANDLGFDGTETDFGLDVIGSFIVNGETETAEGRGRLLVGDSENEITADLQVEVTLSNSQVVTGTDGVLTVTKGIAARLDDTLGTFLDPVTGRIATVNDQFDTQLEDIQTSIDRQNELFESRRQALLDEFVALESIVNQLQSTGSFLSAQLSTLPAINAGR